MSATAGANKSGSSIVIHHASFDAAGDPDQAAGGAQPDRTKNKQAFADWNLKRAVDWVQQVRAATPTDEQVAIVISEIAQPDESIGIPFGGPFKDWIFQIKQDGTKAVSASKSISQASLDGPWSKLPPGHTFVLLMHGTTGARQIPKGEVRVKTPRDKSKLPKDNGAIKVFDDGHITAVIDEESLEHLRLVSGTKEEVDPGTNTKKTVPTILVQPTPPPPPPPPVKEGQENPIFEEFEQSQADARALLLQEMRDGPFDRILLMACGTGDRLANLAPALATLTNKPVFFNAEPITIDFRRPKDNIHAHVGKSDDESGAVQGDPWLHAPGAAKLQLKSTKDTFLPGSMSMVTPGPQPKAGP